MPNIKELLDDVLAKFGDMSKTDTVVGKPMDVKGKTIIPLVEISVGIGSGGGEGVGEGTGMDMKGREGKGKGQGSGAGVGGGVKITPVSVICVDESGVSAFSVGEKRGFASKLADMMPQIMEKMGTKKE